MSISTCDGIEGYINDGATSFYIKPTRDAFYGHQHHIVYRLKDLYHDDLYSGNTKLTPLKFEKYLNLHFGNRTVTSGDFVGSRKRRRRDVFTETKYVELLIINDNRQFEANGKNLSRTTLRAKQIANLVDAIFKPLNIRVALVAMETWTVSDKIKSDDDAETYLSNLMKYRHKKLLHAHPHDVTQLLTGIPLKDSVRGKAQIMTICTRQSAAVIQDYSVNAAFTANTFAHELGHVFGMYHDEDLPNCVCEAASSQGCVMSGHVNREPATVFSNCSFKGIQNTLTRGLGTCLFNVPHLLFGGSVCGDGIVGRGEDCDCGTTQECIDAGNVCCNHTTCKLRMHAQCGSGVCCENCSFKNRGTLCRIKANECDIPEFCNGESGTCPPDDYIYNGYPCSNNTAYCYWRECLTHDKQCQELWGNTAVSAPDMCYNYHNTQKNNKFGYCKRTKQGRYVACKLRNAKCGKLWCLANAKFPVIGIQRSVMQSRWPYGGKVVMCKGSSLQIGLDVPEPSMTLQGTKCAKGKICLNRRCVSVKQLRGQDSSCSHNCSRNGVCTYLGHCYCFDPWTGIHCEINSSTLTTTAMTTKISSRTEKDSYTTKYLSTDKPWTSGDDTKTITTVMFEPRSPSAFQERNLIVVYIAIPLSILALLTLLLVVVCRCTHALDRVSRKHRKFVVYSKRSDVCKATSQDNLNSLCRTF